MLSSQTSSFSSFKKENNPYIAPGNMIVNGSKQLRQSVDFFYEPEKSCSLGSET